MYKFGEFYERKVEIAGNRTEYTYSVKRPKQNFKRVIRTNYFSKDERKKKNIVNSDWAFQLCK